MTEAVQAQAPTPDGEWRRLSARMLLVHPVREVIRFLPALLAVVFASSSGGQNWWGLAVTGVAVGAGVLRWFTTRFRFTPEQLQVRTGLLRRSTVSAPADRVRSVDVTAPPLHRLLGLAEVRIGTAAGEKQLRLNALTTREAAGLRAELLHRSTVAAPTENGEPATGDVSREEALYRLDPVWLRYAPFGPSGLVAAFAIFGLGTQFVRDTGINPASGLVRDGHTLLERSGVVVAGLIGLLVVLVVVAMLAVIAYALAFWAFSLTRSADRRSLHVTRGLLTTRATSLEVRRLRGVELHRAVPLRWVGGARLRAITTGVKEQGRGMSSVLAPPSPVDVVHRTAVAVLGVAKDADPLALPLRTHGPVASRRRYVRAFVPALVVAIGLGALGWWSAEPGAYVIGVLALALAWPLGRSRAAALGHGLTDRFVVGRSGAVRRTTVVLERSGVVALVTRQSVFQRRAGVCTVGFATAAGVGSYDVLDVPAAYVGPLLDEVGEGLLAQFTE